MLTKTIALLLTVVGAASASGVHSSPALRGDEDPISNLRTSLITTNRNLPAKKKTKKKMKDGDEPPFGPPSDDEESICGLTVKVKVDIDEAIPVHFGDEAAKFVGRLIQSIFMGAMFTSTSVIGTIMLTGFVYPVVVYSVQASDEDPLGTFILWIGADVGDEDECDGLIVADFVDGLNALFIGDLKDVSEAVGLSSWITESTEVIAVGVSGPFW